MKELYPGDQGIWVQYLQLALQRAGQQVMLDGIFGPKTCAAVEKVMGSSGKCAVKEAQWNRLLPFLRGYITHEVKAGDTFFSIAKMYDTTMERVMHANPGTDAGALQIGSTVVVPLNFPLVSGEVPYTSLLTGWIIEGLQARYPYLQVGTIGRSVMGTPLWSLQLGNGPVEVGYNASFHANESITTPVLLKFAERLLEAYADIETFKNQQDTKPMVDQQNIQVQVDHREDVLHHQVIHPEENEQLDNHTDAREEGKNKYKKQGSVRKKTNKETKRTGGNPVGGSFDMKI